MSAASLSEEESTHTVEAQMAHLGQSSLTIEEDEFPEVASLHQQRPVSVVTWSRLQASTAASPLCQKLIQLLNSGLPEDKTGWPVELLAYSVQARGFKVDGSKGSPTLPDLPEQ